MHFANKLLAVKLCSMSITVGTAATPAAGMAAVPAGTAAAGTAPAGTAPAGTAPAGTAPAGTVAESPVAQPNWAAGIALMTGSAAAAQSGAAIAAQAFPVLGPAGVVAIRQWVASSVMLATVRPKFWTFTARQWRPVLGLALVYALMNLSLYISIQRIGLGLGVTIEFLQDAPERH